MKQFRKSLFALAAAALAGSGVMLQTPRQRRKPFQANR